MPFVKIVSLSQNARILRKNMTPEELKSFGVIVCKNYPLELIVKSK